MEKHMIIESSSREIQAIGRSCMKYINRIGHLNLHSRLRSKTKASDKNWGSKKRRKVEKPPRTKQA